MTTSRTIHTDIAVVGGGIVGLATAHRLVSEQVGDVVVLERENILAAHQTGRNSGVIHAGVYYEPGSLMARLCREGSIETKNFCNEHNLPWRETGKIVVATHERERRRLNDLAARAAHNGVTVEHLDAGGLSEYEPHIHGVAGVRVPESAITSFVDIARTVAQLVDDGGGRTLLGHDVVDIAEGTATVALSCATDDGPVTVVARQVVVCAGIGADRLVHKATHRRPEFTMLPFRGEYFVLPDRLRNITSHLIYPVPDPAVPFLGVHLTPMISGTVTVGPNAVLSLARTGYAKGSVNGRDIADMATFAGSYRFAATWWRTGLDELKDSWWRTGYLRRVQKYCPEITLNDLLPHPSGIRAQAVFADGTMVKNFLFNQSPRVLHVINAPSPAATSAFPIARHIVKQLDR